jgi:hypothetical protein
MLGRVRLLVGSGLEAGVDGLCDPERSWPLDEVCLLLELSAGRRRRPGVPSLA